ERSGEHAVARGDRFLAAHRQQQRVPEIGNDHRPEAQDDEVPGRDSDEQVLGELVERVVAIEEAEDAQGENRADPDADVAGGMKAHGRGLLPRVHWTTLPSRIMSATNRCAIDWASMPRVAVPFSPRAFSYSAAPAIPPSSPSSC